MKITFGKGSYSESGNGYFESILKKLDEKREELKKLIDDFGVFATERGNELASLAETTKKSADTALKKSEGIDDVLKECGKRVITCQTAEADTHLAASAVKKLYNEVNEAYEIIKGIHNTVKACEQNSRAFANRAESEFTKSAEKSESAFGSAKKSEAFAMRSEEIYNAIKKASKKDDGTFDIPTINPSLPPVTFDIPLASSTENGLMSKEDKIKLDNTYTKKEIKEFIPDDLSYRLTQLECGSVKESELAHVIGHFTAVPRIGRISTEFRLELCYPFVFDSYKVFIDEVEITSGAIAKGDGFITAPALFWGSDVIMKFYFEGIEVFKASVKRVESLAYAKKDGEVKEILYGCLLSLSDLIL